jgi:hypothetical protein
MRTLHCIIFCILVSSTVGMYAQSQETIDAKQDLRIEQVERVTTMTDINVSALTREIAGLRSSVDRFTGIGIGLGASLTVLQALLVIITIRNGKSK